MKKNILYIESVVLFTEPFLRPLASRSIGCNVYLFFSGCIYPPSPLPITANATNLKEILLCFCVFCERSMILDLVLELRIEVNDMTCIL